MNFLNIFKLQLRQEKYKILIWAISLAAMCFAVISAYKNIFSTPASFSGYVSVIQMPSLTAMVGPVWQNVTQITVSGLFSAVLTTFMGIAFAVMNIFMVLKYTREEEENGNMEMVRSMPVKNVTSLFSTMALCFAANFAIALLIVLGLLSTNEPSVDPLGAITYSATVATFGWFFGCVAAFSAQIFLSGRSALGFSGMILGVLYLARALSDVQYSETLNEGIGTYLNPEALLSRSKSFVENDFTPIIAIFCVSLIILAAAVFLNSIRDLGQAFFADKGGRVSASRLLSSPAGLAIRLQKNTVILWAVSLAAFGVMYGSIMKNVESFISTNEMVAKLLQPAPGQSISELFISMVLMVLGIVCCIPAINTAFFPFKEELGERIENLYSKRVSRWAVISFAIISSCSAGLIAMFGAVIGFWAGETATMENPISFETVFKSMIIYYPALLAISSLVILLTGFGLRASSTIVYGYYAACFLIAYLGNLLDIPSWAKKLTPYEYIPNLAKDEMNWVPIIVLTLLAAALYAAGAALYRRRDLN